MSRIDSRFGSFNTSLRAYVKPDQPITITGMQVTEEMVRLFEQALLRNAVANRWSRQEITDALEMTGCLNPA